MSEGRVALVTGASGGLGGAIARGLAAEGWRLALMSRRGCAEIAAETGGLGLAGSVLSDDDMHRAAAATVARFGRIDGAVFSGPRHADILAPFDSGPLPAPTRDVFAFDPGHPGSPLDLPFDAWHAVFAAMVVAPMRLLKAVLPAMQAGGGGSVVLLSGIEAAQPRATQPLGPVRLALHGMVRLAADRYGRDRIRVNAVAPGLMESGSEHFHPGWTGWVPLGRIGRNTETAGAVSFLLSEAAGYVTGQCLTVDGGLNRTPPL
ncbi:MAG: SDR family oxidoreductase [Rhodobacteraceae bacterium]|jgi:NAD(P)-dependent dehydrogenase (short-subunit alcohol dehydrogenase family)|nr:SDR family oxidoreductase [Paracoccaceae bacterium]